MKRRHLAGIKVIMVIILLSTALLSACAGQQPRYERDKCRFSTRTGRQIQCGYLTVPENRQQTQGRSRTIRLHVAIVKSTNPNPNPDPVVYLGGGPGGFTLDMIDFIIAEFSDVLKERDLIVFDQRGVGYSEPSLDCPEQVALTYELFTEHLSVEEEHTRTLATYETCRDRLVDAGIDLTAYTSAASAADLNDLRLALGYEAWNLYGISYGTRLALTTMRDFPAGIRSVILDSTLPLQADEFASVGANAQRAFNVLAQNCAAHAYCKERYPDLENIVYELAARLNAEPIKMRINDSIQGETYEVLVDGDSFLALLFNMLYDSGALMILPDLIYTVYQGHYYALPQALTDYQIYPIYFSSEGMQQSVECNEEIAFTSHELIEAANATLDPTLQRVATERGRTEVDTCTLWPAQTPDVVENQPVTSDIPALVLAGEYDPITPPAWGVAAAETLAHAAYFEFPDVGHGVIGARNGTARECANTLLLAFLADPTAPLDGSCVGQWQPYFK